MKISKGKKKEPIGAVIYGVPGVGKSELSSKLPNTYHLDIEGSTAQLDVSRNEGPINSWPVLTQAVDEFKKEGHTYGFDTLIVDTVDWAETLAASDVCMRNNWVSIEDPGFGKGWRPVHDMFGKFLDSLTDLKRNGFNVVLLAHSTVQSFTPPDQEGSYDRYKMKLQKTVCALVEEWADMILFMNFKTNVVQDEKTKKLKGQGGRRFVYTEHSAAWEAKNRFKLPVEIDIQQSMTGEDNPNLQKIVSLFSIDNVTEKKQTQSIQNAPEEKPMALGDELDKMEAEERSQQSGSVTVTEVNEAPRFDIGVREPDQLHGQLRTLMENNEVFEHEIRYTQSRAKGGEGYLPVDMALESYPNDIIEGVFVAHWDKVFASIEKLRHDKEKPFDSVPAAIYQ